MESDPIFARFKLAGGRFSQFLGALCSPLGCQQNGPGSIAGVSYKSGGFVDMVLESFSGPHDFANAPWWYNDMGNNKVGPGFGSTFLDFTTNYTTSLVFAAPFAIATIREQMYYSSYAPRKR